VKELQIKNNLLLFLFLVFFFVGETFAQYNYDIKQFGEETVDFLKLPAKWNGNDYLTLSAIAATTVGMMFLDNSVKTALQKDLSYQKSFPVEAGRWWGEPLVMGAVGGLFLLQGALGDNTPNKRIGFEILQSGFYAGATIFLMKTIIGRARPNTGNDPFTFKSFYFGSDAFWSLPSGHTALAFSFSTILSRNVKSTFWKIVAYIPAVLTAFSRVYQNYHWTSDVFLGAAIGYFIASYVHESHNENSQFQVNLNNSSNLISISFKF